MRLRKVHSVTENRYIEDMTTIQSTATFFLLIEKQIGLNRRYFTNLLYYN